MQSFFDRRGLDIFRDHLQAQFLRQRNRRPRDVARLRIRLAVGNERPINLQLGEQQAHQRQQRRMPGAEVVNRQPHALDPQPRHHLGGQQRIADHRAFRDLRRQHPRRHIGTPQRVLDRVRQGAVRQQQWRDIHRDTTVRKALAPAPASGE
ncbi:MAG TPA: hypothetical protein VK726_18060 [Acetobacteraceae bacterium]|jgi:hypothetical protein|nr:hypothetical protein [Acetobacteraceae bacterium]